MRICILSNDNIPLGFLDNDAPKALHFYDDTLHIYLSGTAHTFEFTANSDHEDADLLTVGNKLAFFYEGKPYFMNIMTTEEDESEIKVEAWAFALELLNEQAIAYTATQAMSFADYIKAFGFDSDLLQIGVNEVSNKRITNEWTGESDTILKRLYSLATVFDAEIEFLPVLNDDYSLDYIQLNVYREHSDGNQGVGRRRDDMRFRYGKDVTGVSKTEDITELYTAIRPTGKDDINISSLGRREVKDSEGNLLFVKPNGSPDIRAPQACQRFPSSVGDEKYILLNWSTEYEDVETLYSNALAKLKGICEPQCTYEIKGYIDVGIGDTITVIDEAFEPSLWLETRVTEQKISFTDPTKNSTTFDNTTELGSGISSTLKFKVADKTLYIL